jgi:hypothetical protein
VLSGDWQKKAIIKQVGQKPSEKVPPKWFLFTDSQYLRSNTVGLIT